MPAHIPISQKFQEKARALAEEMASGVGPGDQDIVFLPYIFGSNYNPRARASFVGLTVAHSRAQVIRSVLEGVALCHMVHVDHLHTIVRIIYIFARFWIWNV